MHDARGVPGAYKDLSFDMIRTAQGKLPDTAFVNGDCSKMPFSNECFNSVIGSFFIHHVPKHHRLSLIKECYRILSSGVLALVTVSHAQINQGVFNRFFPEVGDIDRARCPEVREIAHWFRESGFINVKSEIVQDVPGKIDMEFLYRVQQ